MRGVLEYYTDGACDPNPGHGGAAVVLNGECVWMGFEKHPTTNNRMEGAAIIAALKHSAGQACIIYTDSRLWVDILTSWVFGWEKRGWRKGSKGADGTRDIANLDLVKAAHTLMKSSQAQIRWVKGHAGLAGNVAADHWAGQARKQGLSLLLTSAESRR